MPEAKSSFPSELETLPLDTRESPPAKTVCFEWNEDGTRLAYGRNDKSIKAARFEVSRSRVDDVIVIPNAHEKPVSSLSWDPQNTGRLVTVSRDSALKVWDFRNKTHKLIRSLKVGRGDPNFLVKYSKCGSFVAVIDTKNWVTILDASSVQFDPIISVQLLDKIYDFDWSANSKFLMFALESGKIQLFKFDHYTQNDKTLHQLELKFTLPLTNSRITSIKYSPNDKYIIVGANDSQVLVIDASSLVCIKSIASIDEPIGIVDFASTPSGDEEFLAITYEYQTLAKVFDLATGEQLYELKNCKADQYVPFARFHPKSFKTIAFSDESGRCSVLVTKKRGAAPTSSAVGNTNSRAQNGGNLSRPQAPSNTNSRSARDSSTRLPASSSGSRNSRMRDGPLGPSGSGSGFGRARGPDSRMDRDAKRMRQ